MFDFKNIVIKHRDDDKGIKAYSFVGIKRNDEEQLEFWLPHGFDAFPVDDTEELKNFFFKMYRTFRKYLERKKANAQEKDMDSEPEEKEFTTDRDGLHEEEKGFSLTTRSENSPLQYAKINALEKVLDGYDELRIMAMENKHRRTEEIDYSHIHRYLHHAVYLEDDVLYIDEMSIPKPVLSRNSPPIVELFCFIYAEVKRELEEETPENVYELAELFKAKHFAPNTTLFGSESVFVTNTLKEELAEIDNRTAYKDEDYWHFYEAIEAFLYFEQHVGNIAGVYFGLNNFYDVWEDLCQCYVLYNNYKHQLFNRENVLFADLKGRLVNFKEKANPFELKLNPNKKDYKPRYLKPDLVVEELIRENDLYELNDVHVKGKGKLQGKKWAFIKTKDHDAPNLIEVCTEIYNYYKKNCEEVGIEGKGHFKSDKSKDDFVSYVKKIIRENITYFIIDYKYLRSLDIKNYNSRSIDSEEKNKLKVDIQKQLIYEWTVQKNYKTLNTKSEFWLPAYNSEKTKFKLSFDEISPDFSESCIEVYLVNFKKLQDFYLTKHIPLKDDKLPKA